MYKGGYSMSTTKQKALHCRIESIQKQLSDTAYDYYMVVKKEKKI